MKQTGIPVEVSEELTIFIVNWFGQRRCWFQMKLLKCTDGGCITIYGSLVNSFDISSFTNAANRFHYFVSGQWKWRSERNLNAHSVISKMR